MKTCRVCGETKPGVEFREGHKRCKACTAVARRQYRLANLERERESNRLWYAANATAKITYARGYQAINRTRICARRREWQKENREAEAERNRRRYWEEPEKRREAARRWARENPERNVAAAHKRRSLIRSLDLGENDHAYISVLRSDPCGYCGDAGGTVDHIEPLNSGGSGKWVNLTASCRACNSSKGTATLLTFLAARA